ncbi:helix-turn-helix domain-containing protein [Duganella sp. FT92W]|uniref:Helix-turn-helix domain-containing protein n=1 Tax=Pseudoduganella rivuli TaxID=2666085 RepID=A0A7X2LV52_9BURK|nr:Crp/Fnr family transcriptional regulator [Pseudoduganella rivuli]MRV73574.1 helix-turn-helix domain-containing protein [Pseudoduganella rivuli]
MLNTQPISVPTRPALPVSLTGAQQNDLLRALERDELESLFPHLELVQLPAGKELYGYGERLDYAYLPTNAIISLQYINEDGATTEIAMIGREGIAGAAMYPDERATHTAIVQCAGYAYRLHTDVLRNALRTGGTLAQQLMRYTSIMFAQLAQSVVSSRHSSIDQKLCRWLLDRLDRSLSEELKVTQEAIANLLGVRRESITAACGKLQADGMIECRRGKIVVLDREGLELGAGACYFAARGKSAQFSGADA